MKLIPLRGYGRKSFCPTANAPVQAARSFSPDVNLFTGTAEAGARFGPPCGGHTASGGGGFLCIPRPDVGEKAVEP